MAEINEVKEVTPEPAPKAVDLNAVLQEKIKEYQTLKAQLDQLDQTKQQVLYRALEVQGMIKVLQEALGSK